ncbi:MAG TPA: decarboxylating 6-phosphogluconate dehydrogenase [Polyangiaceae bacterium]
MRLAMIGLGKMGYNMTLRLVGGGHEVVAVDRNLDVARELAGKGAVFAESVADAVGKLKAPRVAWVMVPAQVTDAVIDELGERLSKGDIVIDGGNSNWKDSRARAEKLAAKGIHWCDAGTSGGIWGLKNGYCLMVGGSDEAVKVCEPIFTTLAPPNGYAHVGPAGAGHYVKMVHNGIEYGLMQAYAEGFEIMKTSPFGLDLHEIASIWGQGSVVRSWLLELLESALKDDADLKSLKGFVEDSGEGRWTVQASIDQNVPAPVITLSLLTRFRSRQEESYGAKILAALRNQFGGHAVKKS